MRWSSCVLAALALSLPAPAVTFVVNDTSDAHDGLVGNGVCSTPTPGVCTLRAALDEANATTGATIQLPAGTFTLALGSLQVQTPVTIAGAGASATTISGNDLSAIFAVFSSGLTTFRGLTLRDGNAGTGFGGAIGISLGAVTVDSCVITHCYARGGGGIAVAGGEAFTITKTSITDCHAQPGDSSADGGALSVTGPGSAVGCTFSGNSATASGGAVYQSGGAFDLVNCTIQGNTAVVGGGLRVGTDGVVRLYNTTVAYNIGTTQAGGIANVGGASASLTLRSSVVAGNGHASGQLFVNDDCSGIVDAVGTNIMPTVDAGHCLVNGTVATTSPSFGPLRDNGGPTQTLALKSGSAGLDAVDSCTGPLGSPLATDQRGVSRPIGSKCDLGAYERSPCGDANGDGVVSVLDVFAVINHLFAGGPIPPGLGNVNGDAVLGVSDVFYLVNALLAGGSAPSCPGT